jgi:hypothetical protein
MSVGVCSDDLIAFALNGLKAKWVADGTALRIVLYQNNYTPTTSSTYSSFTPASFTGSAPQVVDASHFGSAVVSAHVATITNSDTNTFTNSSADQVVYGYLVYDNAGPTYLCAERFDNPQTVSVGAQLGVQPVVALQSGP